MEGDFIVFPNKYFQTFIEATSTVDVVGLKGKERKKERNIKKNKFKSKNNLSKFHLKSPLFISMLCWAGLISNVQNVSRCQLISFLSFRAKNAFYLLLLRRKTRWIRTINPDNWRHLMDFCGAGWGSSDNTPSSVGLGERKYNCAVLQMRALDIKTSLQWGYRKT